MTDDTQILHDISRELADVKGALSSQKGLKQFIDRRLHSFERSVNEQLSARLEQLVSTVLAQIVPGLADQLAPAVSQFLLPRFAHGGVIDGPQMLALGGENGPEAVLPLERTEDGRLGVVSHTANASGVSQLTPSVTVIINSPQPPDDDARLADNALMQQLSDELGDALAQAVTVKVQEALDAATLSPSGYRLSSGDAGYD